MSYNRRTNQYTLTITVDQELHDYLKQALPSNKLSEFIRLCINNEINRQKEQNNVDIEKQD